MTPSHHERDRLALKTALRLLVADVGGLEAAHAVTGHPISRLSEAGSPHHMDRCARVDHVAQLEAHARQPHVTAVLARLAGCTLLPLPRQHGSEAQALAEVLRGAGDLGGRTATALADGGIDDAERAELLAGLAQLARAAAHAQAVLAGAGTPSPAPIKLVSGGAA